MFQNLNVLLITFFIILFLYILNYRLKKDGFDFESFLDLIVLGSLLGGVVLYYVSFWLQNLIIFKPASIFLKPTPITTQVFFTATAMFLFVLIYTKLKNWSVYRVLDVLNLTIMLTLSITAFLLPLVNKYYLGILWGLEGVGMYVLLTNVKDRFIPSGFISSLISIAAAIIFYVNTKNPFDIIYLGIFAILGISIFFFRIKDQGFLLAQHDKL